MSDISPEYIEQLKARDARYRALDNAIAVDSELRSSRVVQIVIEQAGREAADALEALARVNPADTDRIIELQAICYRARFIEATINHVLAAGRAAQDSLNAEEFGINEET